MAWVDYMITAASHSKGNAKHWFRYLRKDIDNYGKLFTQSDIDALLESEFLTPFQKVSLRAAFTKGSSTWAYISNLNSKGGLGFVSALRKGGRA